MDGTIRDRQIWQRIRRLQMVCRDRSERPGRADHQKDKSAACKRGEEGYGQRSESWPKPQLKHRHIISSAALKDP